MHWTWALHVLEHAIYSVVRRLIHNLYEANKRTHISVQIATNNFKKILISLLSFCQCETRACSPKSFVTLIQHLVVGSKVLAEQGMLLPRSVNVHALSKLQEPLTATAPRSVPLARLSWLRADLNRTEGACERSQSILLGTQVTRSYQTSPWGGMGKALLLQSTSARSSYMVSALFAKRRAVCYSVSSSVLQKFFFFFFTPRIFNN